MNSPRSLVAAAIVLGAALVPLLAADPAAAVCATEDSTGRGTGCAYVGSTHTCLLFVALFEQNGYNGYACGLQNN